MDFPDKWAAIVWMCRNQLGRRNITDEQKTVLIGEASKAQKMTRGNNAERGPDGRYLMDQSGPSGGERTRSIIAKQFGVGQGTVQRAEQFLDGLDAADKVSPGIKDAVLAGEIKAPKKVIAEIRNLPEEKQKGAAEAIKRGEIEKAKSYIRPIPKQEGPEEPDALTFSPDMEKILFCVFGTRWANPPPPEIPISPRGGAQI